MASVVVPFRAGGKKRLEPAPADVRHDLALAMLADVIAAAVAVGETVLVANDRAAARTGAALRARVVADPGGGQGAAVEAGLDATDTGPVLVVNADVPCAQPRDLLALLGALPDGGMALVAADDGTTNALALSAQHLFEPAFGPASAARFLARAGERGIDARLAAIPNLVDDVDTLADLERLEPRVGPRTAAALHGLRAELAS